VKISQRKIKENIAKLKEIGLIERIGSAKGGFWLVKNQQN
jgi:ATP-dependent DNA helicase RecG